MLSLPTSPIASVRARTPRISKRRVGVAAALAIGLFAGLEVIASAHPREDVKLYARAAYITLGGALMALGFQRS